MLTAERSVTMSDDHPSLEREALATVWGGIDLGFVSDINWPLWSGVAIGVAAWAEKRRLEKKIKRRRLP